MEEATALKAMKVAMTVVGKVSPRSAAEIAHRVFFSPRRHPAPPREREWLRTAESLVISTPRTNLVAHAWGSLDRLPWEERAERRTVLLVHGWEGRGAQLGAFVAPLVERGYRVVALDGPAHGSSPGRTADVIRMSEAIAAAGRQLGPLRAVIAHSMGAAAATDAVAHHRLDVDRVVLVGGPHRAADVVQRFTDALGIAPPVEAAFMARVQTRLGAEAMARLDFSRAGERLDVPALIIHDELDAEVPFTDGEATARAWPGAIFHKTRGLGHRRILRDPAVVERVTAFVADGHTVTEGARAA